MHVPFCFYPDASGGTEVYVDSLCRGLGRIGITSVVAAPAPAESAYGHDGIPVRRFAAGAGACGLEELYGGGSADSANSFGRVLDAERPDIVHLHAFTRAASVRLVREGRKRGIPFVFTYHTPTVSCQRGSMMRWGREICDGRMDARRCAACVLQQHGAPRWAAEIASRVPAAAGRAAGAARLSGGAWTGLRMRSLLESRTAATEALFSEVERVVAVCDWVREVILRNGVPPAKVFFCRQGIEPSPSIVNARRTAGPLRMAYLGRIHPTKGIHLLLEAMRLRPSADVTLDVFGVDQDGGGYRRRIVELAAGDTRVRFREPVPGGRVSATLAGFDALAVPSQWMESGPMVVLEAFAAGVPVIGSDLGGIAELVRDGIDGVLVRPHASAEAWARAIDRLLDRGSLDSLRAGVKPPRTMSTVAEEMAGLYRGVLGGPR